MKYLTKANVTLALGAVLAIATALGYYNPPAPVPGSECAPCRCGSAPVADAGVPQ